MSGTLKFLLKLGLTAVIVALVIRLVEIDGVIAHLRSARPGPFAASLACLLAIRVVAACRTKFLIDAQGLSVSIPGIWRINLISSFYSLFLPGSLPGGAVRWYRFARPDKAPAEAFAVILFDRLLDTLGVVAVGLACWWLDPGADVLAGAALGGLLAVLLAFYLLALRERHAARVTAAAEKIPILPERLRGRVAGLVAIGQRCLGLPRSSHAVMLGLTTLKEGLGVLGYWFILSALDLDVALLTIAWVRAVVLVVTMLPISISGIGTREFTLQTMLAPHAVPAEGAVAAGVLIFAGSIWLALWGAAFELHGLWWKRSHTALARSDGEALR